MGCDFRQMNAAPLSKLKRILNRVADIVYKRMPKAEAVSSRHALCYRPGRFNVILRVESIQSVVFGLRMNARALKAATRSKAHLILAK